MQSSKPKVQGALSSNSDVGETIDGVERVQVDDAPRSAAPDSPACDYPELIEVARDHYVIGEEIAKGGMGRVVEARDLRLGRAVAIKELLPRNRDAARRFEREARITAKLQHPAIINIHEAGVWAGGEPFYAMTKVAGRSLDKVVAERATLIERLGLLPNVIAVADALAYAHSQHVIHRDLKPSNVLVGEFGETVVIDWGLAKDLGAPGDPALSLSLKQPAEETLSGSVVGTPAYMPPEQARGEPVDQRADVYALGALLYHVLVGAPPYGGKRSKDVLAQVLAGSPVPVEDREPGAPADLVTIVAKAMHRDPEARYPSASELASDLKRFQTGQLVAAHHYSRVQLLWRWVRRNRLVVAIGVAAAITLAMVGALSVRRIVDERNRAELEQRKDELRRAALLEERGRTELASGRAGPALVNLVGAVRQGHPQGALGFLIADAMRPFEAEVATLPVGPGDVVVAYRPDGQMLATGSSNGEIVVWKLGASPVELLRTKFGAVRALAWSPDGVVLASGGDDGSVRIWRGATLEQTFAPSSGIADLQFSNDGARLLVANLDGVARIWRLADTTAPALVLDPALDRAEPKPELTSARFSPDNRRIATAAVDGSANVWAPGADQFQTPLRGHSASIRVARWNPDGDLVLTASADGTARIWNPTKGKLAVAPMLHDRKASIEDAAWSHDGRRVLTAGADRTARVWELPEIDANASVVTPARLVAQLPHTDTVVACEFSADDRWIATAGRVARVWDAAGQQVAAFEQADAVRTIAFRPDGNALATGTRGGSARVWDVSHGIAGARVDLESPVHAIAVGRDGTVAAGTDDSRVTVWSGGASTVLRKHLGRVFTIAFSPDGTQLVTAGEDAEALVWTLPSETKVREVIGFSAPVRAAAFSADGATVVLGDAAGMLWFASARGPGAPHAMPGLRGGIAALAVATNGNIAGVGPDGSVVVWNARGAVIARTKLGIELSAVAFDPTGSILAVGGNSEVQLAATLVRHALAGADHRGSGRRGPVDRVLSRWIARGHRWHRRGGEDLGCEQGQAPRHARPARRGDRRDRAVLRRRAAVDRIGGRHGARVGRALGQGFGRSGRVHRGASTVAAR